jgi:hypothetical protein
MKNKRTLSAPQTFKIPMDLEWRALPFAMSQTGGIDRHKHIATSEGTLSFYVEAKATKDFCQITFRPSGANTGTP